MSKDYSVIYFGAMMRSTD